MAGATFGVFLRTKDQKMKQFSLSALLSIFFAGITEPAIYGVGLKYKKPIAAAFVGGAIGGAFMGGMGVKAYAFVFGGLTTIPAFAGPTLVWYVIGLAICFVVSAIVMVIMGVDDTEAIEQQAEVDAIEAASKVSTLKGSKVMLPVSGEVKDLSECTDEMFRNRALGDGVLVIPDDGKIVAPFDGTVTALFDTGHAIGLTSDDGLEVLIHIGLDTVELNGKPFDVKVSQGEHVKLGQLLMNVDLEQIKASGKSTETPVIVTNAGGLQVVALKAGKLDASTPVISIK
jgi:PTS system beta-glucosides-specific IIC component